MIKSVNLLLQAAFWIALWLVFNLSAYAENRPPEFYWLSVLRVVLFAIYFNVVYFFVLNVYFKGKKIKFYALAFLTFSLFLILSYILDSFILRPDLMPVRQGFELPDGVAPMRVMQRPWLMMMMPPIIIGIAIFGLSAALRAFAELEKNKKAAEEAERRRLETEIALLKSQINPHFLLNTFNNLYALSITNPAVSPAALLRVSEMMQYILYECSKKQVLLADDVAFIENYLHLQEMRLPPIVRLKYSLPESIPESIQIEPMILIPFIENAFKHGISTKTECFINIEIKLEGFQLSVLVENDVLPRTTTLNNPSGMGIDNTIKRLDHSYGEKYKLTKTMHADRHQIVLIIDLS